MEFNLSEDQLAFAEAARDFASNEMAPNAGEWDAKHIFPRRKPCARAAGAWFLLAIYTP